MSDTFSWEFVDIVGDDRPHDLSEFTVLSLYVSKSDNEPTSIIVWGGYGECNRWNVSKTPEDWKALYGEDDYREFAIPYRRRLLRLDVATNVWKKLKPTMDMLPKAQLFAAVSKCEDGVLLLLIGDGYEYNPGEYAKDARASRQCRPEVLARTSLELQKGKDKQRYCHHIALFRVR